jgi:hypothetical protein
MAVPNEQEAGWGPHPVWRSGVKKNLLGLPGFEPPVVYPVDEGKVGLRSPQLLRVRSYNISKQALCNQHNAHGGSQQQLLLPRELKIQRGVTLVLNVSGDFQY